MNGAPVPAYAAKIAHARSVIHDLCQGTKLWSMCVPARLDYDPDLILSDALTAAEGEIKRLRGLIDNPHTDDFLQAVQLEAAHQRERWGVVDDAGKSDPEWFWLIGHLLTKALTKPEKVLHHIITAAACCLNWHAHKTGASTAMRPGIDPDKEKFAGDIAKASGFTPPPSLAVALAQLTTTRPEEYGAGRIALAYGFLWLINTEPGTPAPMFSPERAAYEARKILMGLLTNPEREAGINAAKAATGAA